MKNVIFLLVLGLTLSQCKFSGDTGGSSSSFDEEDLNAPAEGFDLESSDPLAIVIADRVMHAMGGRRAWDQTRYLSWNFFGSRKLLWDKTAGRVRIESSRDDQVVLLDLKEMTGRVFRSGTEEVNTDSVSYYLEQGWRTWINDSYWLVMPYKLKDTGVTLTYLKEDTTQMGEWSDVLKLTFDNVGVSPENAYWVWVSKETNLVKQWAYYAHFTDLEPRFLSPWGNYQQLGNILLSNERGTRELTEVEVLESVPEERFASF